MGDMEKVTSCALLANWGLGAALLGSLLQRTDVAVCFVVTAWDHDSADPWQNAVHDMALASGIACHQERELSFDQLQALLVAEEVDLLLVHAGRRILPEKVFAAPRRGSINFHPSLLPRHRGGAPSYWVLRQKELQTGLTSHVIDAGMDTGPIVAQAAVPVTAGDSIGSIVEKLKHLVPELVQATFERLADPSFTPEEQDETLATYDPRPPKD